MCLAATFATWYWTFNKADVPYFTVTHSVLRILRWVNHIVTSWEKITVSCHKHPNHYWAHCAPPVISLRYFIICMHHQLLLQWSSKREWDGWIM
jgi:hypothetical protein